MNFKLIKLLLCSLVFVLIDPVSATESESSPAYLGLHTMSVHLPKKDYQNNQNWGFYVERNHWQVGVYSNTLDRASIYGGYVQPLAWDIHLMVGVVSGYQERCDARYELRTYQVLGPTGIEDRTERVQVGEDCYGSSRGFLAPMLALAWRPQAKFLGASPEIVVPAVLPKQSLVVHLSLRWEIGK